MHSLISGLRTLRRSLVRRNGKTILKDAKTHQTRVIALDQDTVAILTAQGTSAAPLH